MAEKPDDRVLMVHEAFKEFPDVVVEVSRHEFHSVWEAVGWKLQPVAKKKEG